VKGEVLLIAFCVLSATAFALVVVYVAGRLFFAGALESFLRFDKKQQEEE